MTPASSSSTISRVRGSAAHSWSARPASTASRTVWVSTSASCWCRKPTQQPAGPRDPAGVAAPPGRSSPRAAWSCRRRCGRRRRSARPRRRRARPPRAAGGRRTPWRPVSRLRRLAIRVATGRDVGARRPGRWRPARRAGRRQEGVGQGARVVAASQRNTHRRARAGDHAAQRALGLAAGDQVAELRAQVERGGLEVVVERGGEPVGRRRPQRGEHVGGLAGRRRARRGNISSNRR